MYIFGRSARWLILISETRHRYVAAEIVLAWGRRLLEIFGQGPCQFGIFGSGLTSVEGVDAPDQSPREDMLCVYVGRR